MSGLSAPMLGQEQIVPVIGPISTSLSGIKVFMKTLVDAKPWLREASLLPFPWRTEPQIPVLSHGGKKLRIGVMYDDGVVRPHPPILRALRLVAEKLVGIEGVEVVEWKPYKHDLAWSIISSLYFCDGGAEDAAAIAASGEPWRPLSTFIIKENPGVKNLTIRELWDRTMARNDYRSEYARVWHSSGIDVLLCPVGPGVAPAHDEARYWGYTAQWNLLDYPALVLPVDKMRSESDGKEEGYVPRGEKDAWHYHLCKPTFQDGSDERVNVMCR